jgi:hypothetical protein
MKADEDKGYDQTDVGVFYHAWYAYTKGRGRHVGPRQKPGDTRSSGGCPRGGVIPLIDRDVYYAASEMQLLENGIRRFKDKLTVLIQADNDAPLRRKEGGQGCMGEDERRREERS